MKKAKEWFGGIMNSKIAVAVGTTIVLSVLSFGGDLLNREGLNPKHNKDTLEAEIDSLRDTMNTRIDTVEGRLTESNAKLDNLDTKVSLMSEDMKLIKEHLLGKEKKDVED